MFLLDDWRIFLLLHLSSQERRMPRYTYSTIHIFTLWLVTDYKPVHPHCLFRQVEWWRGIAENERTLGETELSTQLCTVSAGAHRLTELYE